MKYSLSIALALMSFFPKAQEELTLSKAVNYALEHKAERAGARSCASTGKCHGKSYLQPYSATVELYGKSSKNR